jgi:predicted DNA repair protein MutK
LLDDVAVLTKVAAKKTAGVLGDDLALNAQQVSGVQADRELPVVWAVAKGSARNKLILVPLALAISAFAPWGVVPLLMLGGAFLCFEGVEKVAHRLLHSRAEDAAHHEAYVAAVGDPAIDLVAFERDKIKGAIRTDFILSAEIIAISLATVAAASFGMQVATLLAVSAIMTIGVYGLVAGIVKLDDAGLRLSRSPAQLGRRIGGAILLGAPYLMKFLSVAGTAAMFLVGGGIVAHGIPPLHHLVEQASAGAADVPSVGALLGTATGMALNAVTGLVTGAIIVAVVSGVKRLRRRRPTP